MASIFGYIRTSRRLQDGVQLMDPGHCRNHFVLHVLRRLPADLQHFLIWLQTPCTLSQAAAGSFLFSSSSGDSQLLGRVSYKLYLHFTAQHVG